MENLLKNTRIFRHLDEAEINRLIPIMQEVHYKKDEIIFSEGDVGDALYIIGQGSVRVEKQDLQQSEEILAILRNGESFGEISLVDQEVRSASCLANEDSVLLRLTRENFEQVVHQDRDMALKACQGMVQILCERLRATNESLTFSRSLLMGVMDREK